MESQSPAGGPGRRSKVARLIEEYELEDIGAELEARWTAPGEDRLSLRALADAFNRRLLEAALQSAGVHALAGEVENRYRLLTDEDVGAADRTRARRWLEREGVDVAALEDDFVSYQAIRTYLTNHREATYEPDTDVIAEVEGTIGRLRSRLATVTESRLKRAREAEAIDLGGFDVTVAVRVACRDCGRQVEVGDLLEDGGCDCA